MPRRARIAPGELVYHTLNRPNGRNELFAKPEDFSAFERIMVAAMHPNRGTAEMREPWASIWFGKLEDAPRECTRVGIKSSSTWQT